MKKEGVCEWYQSIGLIFLDISANLLLFFKDPGPLNNKNRFSVAKQLSMRPD
jgi:hypothetical protein